MSSKAKHESVYSFVVQIIFLFDTALTTGSCPCSKKLFKQMTTLKFSQFLADCFQILKCYAFLIREVLFWTFWSERLKYCLSEDQKQLCFHSQLVKQWLKKLQSCSVCWVPFIFQNGVLWTSVKGRQSWLQSEISGQRM